MPESSGLSENEDIESEAEDPFAGTHSDSDPDYNPTSPSNPSDDESVSSFCDEQPNNNNSFNEENADFPSDNDLTEADECLGNFFF